MSYYGKKEFLTAITCLKKAIYLNPFDIKIIFNLGIKIYIKYNIKSIYYLYFKLIRLNFIKNISIYFIKTKTNFLIHKINFNLIKKFKIL